MIFHHRDINEYSLIRVVSCSYRKIIMILGRFTAYDDKMLAGLSQLQTYLSVSTKKPR